VTIVNGVIEDTSSDL